MLLPNTPQYVITFFAALRLGAVVVPHDPAATSAELHEVWADCTPEVVVCLDRLAGTVAQARPGTSVRTVVLTHLADGLPARRRLPMRLPGAAGRRARRALGPAAATPTRLPDALSFLALLHAAGVPARQARLDPETAPAVLQYARARHGRLRGAVLTHANLVAGAYALRLWDVGAVAGREVVLGVLPLCHAYGATVTLTSTVLLGGTLVLLPRPGLDQVLTAAGAHAPTSLAGVPALYRALSGRGDRAAEALSGLRLCVSGVGALPEPVRRDFEALTGARLVQGYGFTEASGSTHCAPTTAAAGRRPGIGLPLPGIRCAVLDLQDPTREVPVGSPGGAGGRRPAGLRRLLGGRRPAGPAGVVADRAHRAHAPGRLVRAGRGPGRSGGGSYRGAGDPRPRRGQLRQLRLQPGAVPRASSAPSAWCGATTSPAARRPARLRRGAAQSRARARRRTPACSVELVGRCEDEGVPLLGVCLGHQAIAVAHGAPVGRAPELLHGKTSEVLHEGAGVLHDLPTPVHRHPLPLAGGRGGRRVPAELRGHRPDGERGRHGAAAPRPARSRACSSTPSRCSPRAGTCCSPRGCGSAATPRPARSPGAVATRVEDKRLAAFG